jgi:hypothetical protein
MKTKQVTFNKVVKGQHRVRIEYFQKGGNAGCIFKYKKGKSKTWKVFPASRYGLSLRHYRLIGLKEEIYYGSKSSKVPNLNAKKPNVQRVVPRVAYSNTGAKWRGFTAKDNFAVRWSGSLKFTKTGTYRFQIASDDGSNLYMNNLIGYGSIRNFNTGTAKLIDNDGAHGMRKKEATTKVFRKSVPIVLTYFEAGGHAGMLFKYMGKDSGMKMKIVPARALGGTLSATKTPASSAPFKLIGSGPCGTGGKYSSIKYWNSGYTYARCRKTCLANKKCKSFTSNPVIGYCNIRVKVADSITWKGGGWYCWNKAG